MIDFIIFVIRQIVSCLWPSNLVSKFGIELFWVKTTVYAPGCFVFVVVDYLLSYFLCIFDPCCGIELSFVQLVRAMLAFVDNVLEFLSLDPVKFSFLDFFFDHKFWRFITVLLLLPFFPAHLFDFLINWIFGTPVWRYFTVAVVIEIRTKSDWWLITDAAADRASSSLILWLFFLVLWAQNFCIFLRLNSWFLSNECHFATLSCRIGVFKWIRSSLACKILTTCRHPMLCSWLWFALGLKTALSIGLSSVLCFCIDDDSFVRLLIAEHFINSTLVCTTPTYTTTSFEVLLASSHLWCLLLLLTTRRPSRLFLIWITGFLALLKLDEGLLTQLLILSWIQRLELLVSYVGKIFP